MSENLLAEWSRVLVESLADAGLERLVVSPGSRSTPFVWAALSCPRLRCESVMDERCAAFYAVGWAKMTGKPVALLCTSGSAAANYFPAVVEASSSHTPVLLLTADRPYELMDCGAAQTIDQVKLYGGYVRHFVDVGLPEESDAALRALRRVAGQAIVRSVQDPPGPVHLNLRARKPLEPEESKSKEATDLAARVDRVLQGGICSVPRARLLPNPHLIAHIAARCRRAQSGVIVCGPMNPAVRPDTSVVSRLARAAGFPLFAEATSGLRLDYPASDPLNVDAFGTLLGSPSFRRRAAPDVALQIGAAPTSGAWETLTLTQRQTARFVFAPYGWPDPASSAAAIVSGDVTASLIALTGALEDSAEPRGQTDVYAAMLREANALAWNVIADELGTAELTEAAAVRVVVDQLPEHSLFCVGNSLPVREVDAFSRARAAGIAVWSQRGASGIDGVLSGASGAARAFDGATTLLLGDVSFLHDLGGLHLLRRAEKPFVVVVLNNDGGRIFEQLPVGSRADLPRGAMDFWTTPHGLDFEPAARLCGVHYARVRTQSALLEALSGTYSRRACTVVEVVVEPDSARKQQSRIATKLEASFARAEGNR